MTHALGRVVADGRTFTHAAPLSLNPGPGPLGGPRFVFLHFDSVVLNGGARLEVDLGYDTDVFTAASGSDFWSRPISGATSPITMRIVGGTGSARLLEFGSGEPTQTANPPGTSIGSRSNPDPFLITNPYQEPIYETRLECHPGFTWRNARCSLPTIPDAVRDRVRAATGIIVEGHDFTPGGGGHVSSCSGTLIAGDLFLTARHCITDPSGRDVRSASVTFDYETACDGSRPAGHNPRFFKVVEEVASGTSATGGTNTSNDWVVVRLDGAPGELPAPLEMRDAALMAGETVFTMHHPNGSVKKTQEGVHGGGTNIIGFDYCGGSSGSALFDSSGRLVRGPLSVGPLGSACTVAYTQLAGIKSALTSPPPPPAPLDVMIVFDRSGSMAGPAPPIGRSKLEEAQDASSLFVQLVREGVGDRLGLVTFSSGAGLDRPPGAAATVKPLLVGPPPFTSGQIGAISAGGATSIGAGLGMAQLGFGASVGNGRAMLLLTDGLQNTAPMIEEVESFLGTTKLNVIGFGSDADIDGPLLTRVAHQHGGHFTRALDGLGLRKFFGLSFGNIFESGALADPEFVLRKDQAEATHLFRVCGEEHITVILGWDDPDTRLRARIYTPSGKLVAADRRVRTVSGRSWLFWKIPLPYATERDGQWKLIVDREPQIPVILRKVRKSAKSAKATKSVKASVATHADTTQFPSEVRYFYLVTAIGGPKLTYLGAPRHVYTGDVLHPRVALQYGNGTVPHDADVELITETPTVALGRLAMDAGLRAPTTSGDAVDAFHATLQAVARGHGGNLPVGTTRTTLSLFDDGAHEDGAMEPDGIYNHPLHDFTRAEGTYTFRAVATYGENCRATREVHWSVHVEPGIDPTRTQVTLVDVHDVGGGRRGTLVLVPHDRYGNPLGPGRGGVFTVDPIPGVEVIGPVKDRGDGSYGVDVSWDPDDTSTPGVIVQQPDRPPVPVRPGKDGKPDCPPDCSDAAGKLLDCLGLHDPSVERVRVTRVNVEIDLKDDPCDPCRDRDDDGPHDPKKPSKPRKPEGDCGC
ncbi:trypsin-like peptidase domain-containing protein [Lysobacter panacisoli]|uniref:VWFA domain-containing protein n=1 Tax=Lysobacter panacisoli TaxID=1255263 RepID=A0ABP9L9L9_9GAMM|nr:trypsin-like peptidase domain-containing protein [Lysobacter panacisoli]